MAGSMQGPVVAPRGTTRANTLANYLGSGLTAVMAIAMSPIYLHLLGAEAFGLVGLFSALVAFSSVFELGITAAVVRQLARLDTDLHRESCQAVATLERIYAVIGLLLGAILCACGPAAALSWLNPQSLDQQTIVWSMIWLGVGFACRWNVSFYSAGLTGMERLVGLNAVVVITALCQYLGVILVLYLWKATPPVFFAYMAGCGLVQMLVLRTMLWRLVGWGAGYRRWHLPSLGGIRTFAGGMGLISLTSVILTQADKIILSRLMTLASFGIYSFAANTAAGTQRIISPIFNAIYPRMTRLVGADERQAAAEFYQLSAQAVACLLAPAVITAVAFSGSLLRVWTRDAALAEQVGPVLSLFLLGNLLNGLMHAPLALLLAHGRTGLLVCSNLISIALLVPAAILVYRWHGAIGVAGLWCALNLGYILIQVPVMHRQLAWPGMWTWYWHSVLLPIGVSAAIAGTASWFWIAAADLTRVLLASLVAIVCLCGIALVSPGIRVLAAGRLGTWALRARPGK
jgi:O-antigen/teichoic acid export membrane protein